VGKSLLAELLAGGFHPVDSAAERSGLEDLRRELFALLDVIRVYAKEPGKPADRERPFVLKRGRRWPTSRSPSTAIWRPSSASRGCGAGTPSMARPCTGITARDGDVLELHA